MDAERIEKVLASAELALSTNDERFTEIEAMLSAQRFLLEQAYANTFMGNPDGFAKFMEGALEKTRSKSTSSGPIPDEVRTELVARIATHLSRFGESVQRRLRQGFSSK